MSLYTNIYFSQFIKMYWNAGLYYLVLIAVFRSLSNKQSQLYDCLLHLFIKTYFTIDDDNLQMEDVSLSRAQNSPITVLHTFSSFHYLNYLQIGGAVADFRGFCLSGSPQRGGVATLSDLAIADFVEIKKNKTNDSIMTAEQGLVYIAKGHFNWNR